MNRLDELSRFRNWFRRKRLKKSFHLTPSTQIRGLEIPPLLVALMAGETPRWKTPADDVISKVIPWLREPIEFLPSIEHIGWSSTTLVDVPGPCEYRSSDAKEGKPLPWLDVDRALFIAVSKEIGVDEGVCLDFRTDRQDPRVVAIEWTQTHAPGWRQVTDRFSRFVELCDL